MCICLNCWGTEKWLGARTMVKEALQTDDATKYKDGLMSMHSQTESYHSAIFHIIYWSSKLNLSKLLVLGGLWSNNFLPFHGAGGHCRLDGKIREGERAGVFECCAVKKKPYESSHCCSCPGCWEGTYFHFDLQSQWPVNFWLCTLGLMWLSRRISPVHLSSASCIASITWHNSESFPQHFSVITCLHDTRLDGYWF